MTTLLAVHLANKLQVFRLPNLQVPVFTAEGLTFLPPFLTPEFSVRRSSAREMVLEILVAEIGDSVHKSPYLIVCAPTST